MWGKNLRQCLGVRNRQKEPLQLEAPRKFLLAVEKEAPINCTNALIAENPC